MPYPSPRVTLLLLLALALGIAVGGARLARHAGYVRFDRDREPLRRYAEEAQAQLQRLEKKYEDYLEPLAQPALVVLEQQAVRRQQAEELVGVRQLSLIYRRDDATGRDDLHVPVNSSPTERMPVPTFKAPRGASPQASVLLSESHVSKWIDEPGQPLMYMNWTGDAVGVVMIDRAEVEQAVSKWLVAWTDFEPVRAMGGPDQLRARDGHAVLASGTPPGMRPDVILPLRSHLGRWDLASWDRRERRVYYDRPALLLSSAMAALLFLLGVMLHGQQSRAAALAARRGALMNRVSHALRPPLTSILLNVDLAAEALEQSPRVSVDRLSLVREEARRLGGLIDNLLTFSRQEQGKLQPVARACVPSSVVALVVVQFAPGFARRGLQVIRRGEADSPCLLDSDALAQILSNLFSNVEKYVPGGTLEIESRIADEFLAITVTDNGPGLPAAAAERVFRPFERLGGRVNEDASGTGLGLSVARDLARSMGGSLRLLPTPRGASLALRVPAPPAGKVTSVA